MDTFEIRVRITVEDDLYSPYDPDRLTLNGDLLAYLVERYTEKEFGKKTVLRFTGMEIDNERLKAALRHHVETELERNRREKRRNHLKQMRLFLIGLAFVTAGILLGQILDAVPVEILSIVGSFAVWEAANIWIVENPGLDLQRRRFRKLLEAEIVIEPFSEYGIKEQEEQSS